MQPHARRDYADEAFVFQHIPTLSLVVEPKDLNVWRSRMGFKNLRYDAKTWKRGMRWLQALAEDLVETRCWRRSHIKGALFVLTCDYDCAGTPLNKPFVLVLPDGPDGWDASKEGLAMLLGSKTFRTLRSDFPPLRDMVHALQCLSICGMLALADWHGGCTSVTVTPHAGWLGRNRQWVRSVCGDAVFDELVALAHGCRKYDKWGRELL
jgi:hypothetical protein